MKESYTLSISYQIVLDARLKDVDDEARLRELSARREVLGVVAGERVLEVGRDLGGNSVVMFRFYNKNKF